MMMLPMQWPPGKGTDAEGWLNEAVAFWEEQVG